MKFFHGTRERREGRNDGVGIRSTSIRDLSVNGIGLCRKPEVRTGWVR